MGVDVFDAVAQGVLAIEPGNSPSCPGGDIRITSGSRCRRGKSSMSSDSKNRPQLGCLVPAGMSPNGHYSACRQAVCHVYPATVGEWSLKTITAGIYRGCCLPALRYTRGARSAAIRAIDGSRI